MSCAYVTALLLARYVGTACQTAKFWVGGLAAQTTTEPVAGALTLRPLADTLCALWTWGKHLGTDLCAGAIAAACARLCQSYPRDGGQHTTNEGAPE